MYREKGDYSALARNINAQADLGRNMLLYLAVLMTASQEDFVDTVDQDQTAVCSPICTVHILLK